MRGHTNFSCVRACRITHVITITLPVNHAEFAGVTTVQLVVVNCTKTGRQVTLYTCDIVGCCQLSSACDMKLCQLFVDWIAKIA